MTKTKIEWTRGDDGTSGEVWNPISGCDHVSPGCDNCYAERIAKRFKRPFIGAVQLHPEKLGDPLRWRKPRRVFVNSVSDLFHPDVPDSFIAKMFAVMSRASAHTFQILTKRPQAMERILSQHSFVAYVDDFRGGEAGDFVWPLPNVWLGVSVENQRYADLRIPYLLRTPAAVRFLSVEPLLGPVDLVAADAFGRDVGPRDDGVDEMFTYSLIDWVIVGGESGPGARPMQPEWARTVRDQCVSAGVPFFFKQWGEWGIPGWRVGVHDAPLTRMGKRNAGRELDGRTWDEYPT